LFGAVVEDLIFITLQYKDFLILLQMIIQMVQISAFNDFAENCAWMKKNLSKNHQN